jgi:hypothetical protein
MAVVVKSLSKIAVGTSEGDIYTVPLNKAAIVKSIRLVNTTGSAITVNVYVRRGTGGTSFRVLPKDLSIGAGLAIIDDSEITLEGLTAANGEDRIRAIASASGVECVISGVERDQT